MNGSFSPWRRLLRDRLALAGLTIVGALVVVAVAAPWVAPYDPAAVDPVNRLAGPSLDHPLGTDALGRDLLSRIVTGARWSLGTAGMATVVVLVIGVAVGLVTGYYGGVLDAVAMRVVDALLAFPALLLLLAIVGTIGPGLRGVFIGLVAVAWADYARVVRGSVLAIREREYVEAARAVGAPDRRLLLRHVLPGVVSPVLVLATLEMGQLVLALSGLSFLGLGAQPPTPEWGAMLNDGRSYFLTAPQLMLFPGVAITLAVLGLNLLGDGLRDMLDPRLDRFRGGRRSGR
ncbi:MAG: ABC transporter permease subunit [Actinomycetota bacterium]|nr:ABC transporter permease subunit [Actinomycetota bacterium]